jgi:hypothetical protein
MNNSITSFPATVYGYWRPWKENANYWNDYLDYVRDGSLVKYGAETVGKYINQASQEQIAAINQLGQSIGRGMNVLSNQMSDVNKNISFLNQNLSIQIEQQKLSNLLLQNIAELLRVPDSEKERQHSIELGIKFFVNASKDADLYADALEELLKAESLMKQDYFVLHRIGCIYLHVEKFINPEKALEYFLRAAKYASVESDPSTLRLANVLTNNFNTANTLINSSEQAIGLLTAESYEKAAFTCYVLGQFDKACTYQEKSLKYKYSDERLFMLSKYQIRNSQIQESVINLEKAIELNPVLTLGIFADIDFWNDTEIKEMLQNKDCEINSKYDDLLLKLNAIKSNADHNSIINLIEELKSNNNYLEKVNNYDSVKSKVLIILSTDSEYYSKIDEYFNIVNRNLSNFGFEVIDYFKSKLSELKSSIISNSEFKNCITHYEKYVSIKDKILEIHKYPLKVSKEKMDDCINKLSLGIINIKNIDELENIELQINKFISENILEVGQENFGGIIVDIDIKNNRILIVANDVIGYADWGEKYYFNTSPKLYDGKKNTEIIAKKCDSAARICKEKTLNGYTDWFLPSNEELLCIKKIDKLNSKYRDIKIWSSTDKSQEIAHYLWFGGISEQIKFYTFWDRPKEWKNFLVYILPYRINVIPNF